MRIKDKFRRGKNKSMGDILSDKIFMEIYNRCRPFTMVSIERCHCLYRAVEYILNNRIEGSLVECGVWKGGSAMLMAIALLRAGQADKDIWLYDTFAGMTEPGVVDVNMRTGIPAKRKWRKKESGDVNRWCYAPVEEVKANMALTGYPPEKIRFVEGMVEQTLPESRPKKISLLRLDTDWYESTRCEMIYLFPVLEKAGVLILDDYGIWQGSKNAVDEYVEQNNIKILLNRIDKNGAIAVKQ